MFEEISRKIETAGLIPVVKMDVPEDAVPLAEALLKGGISAIEITFRTTEGEAGFAKIAECIKRVSAAHPEMLVGAGTVINPELAKKAVAAGAKFIVSPGFNPETVDYCISENVPVYPGISSPSQVEVALGKGLSVLKFFPAEASGGVKTLKALAGPFPTVKFMATGGINEQNVGEYMKCANIAAVGGSWMVQEKLIKEKNWAEITRLSAQAVKAMLGFKFIHMGMNFDGAASAADAAKEFSAFGYEGVEGNSSWFCGDAFDLMKQNGRGTHGHIAFSVYSIERALSYLEQFGYHAVEETKKWKGEARKSPLKITYLDKEINGFAIHLNRA